MSAVKKRAKRLQRFPDTLFAEEMESGVPDHYPGPGFDGWLHACASWLSSLPGRAKSSPPAAAPFTTSPATVPGCLPTSIPCSGPSRKSLNLSRPRRTFAAVNQACAGDAGIRLHPGNQVTSL